MDNYPILTLMWAVHLDYSAQRAIPRDGSELNELDRRLVSLDGTIRRTPHTTLVEFHHGLQATSRDDQADEFKTLYLHGDTRPHRDNSHVE